MHGQKRGSTTTMECTYIDTGLIVVIHRHCRQLRTDVDHSLGEDAWNTLILVESCYGVSHEVQANTMLVLEVIEEIRHDRIT